MSKKALSFVPSKTATATKPEALAKKVVSDIRRLGVDVSPTVHYQVKERALKVGSINDYVLKVIYAYGNNVKVPAIPFESMRGQKRIILQMPSAQADAVMVKATHFQNFREFVLRCLEADGVEIK